MTLVRRRKLLETLANLPDDGFDFFMKRYGDDYPVEDLGYKIFKHRDTLRKIWRRDHQAFNLVYSWVKEANKRSPYRAKASRTRVFVAPTDNILPLELALGVSELWPKMGICGNPECPNPYYFKSRKTRRFCDRPACTEYGQREQKRNWWRENRAKPLNK